MTKPSDDDEIIENENPKPGLSKMKETTGKKEDDTRQVLAYGILGVLILFYLLPLGAVLLNIISVDELVRINGTLSGLQTLAAAVTGFYFARAKRL